MIKEQLSIYFYGCIQNNMKGQDQIVVLKLKKITVISLVFMIVEILGGYYAHSIAIFADAFHLLSDVLAYVISLFAVLMSYKTSPKGLTFGYEKLQPLGALINVGIIWFVTAQLFIEASQRLFHQQIVEEPKFMLWTSIFGLGCNLYIMKVLHSDEHAGGHHNCSHSHGEQDHKSSHHEHKHGSGCSHGHGTESQSHKQKAHSNERLEQQHVHKPGCKHNHDHSHQKNHQDHKHHHSDDQQHHEHDHHGHNHPHQISQNANTLRQFNQHKHSSSCSHGHSHSISSGNSFSLNTLTDEVRLGSPASDEQIKAKPHRKDDNFHNNINIEAAYIHILTDIILSIGVIISASIIYFFAPEGHVWSYWQIADPICTYLFSIMAIYTTLPILKESLHFLLDGCDDEKIIYEIEQQLKDNPIVQKVQSLRIWSLKRGKYYGALRARVKAGSKRELNHIFSSRQIEGYVQLIQDENHLDKEQ